MNCAVHVHTEIGMAIAGLKSGLRMVSQQAIRFYNRVGYHPYEGITEDFAERARINQALGHNRALIMHNHGLLTVGKTARESFVLMKYLLEAASIQLKMEATGAELIEIPPSDVREDRQAVREARQRPRLRRLARLPAPSRRDRPELQGLSCRSGRALARTQHLGRADDAYGFRQGSTQPTASLRPGYPRSRSRSRGLPRA